MKIIIVIVAVSLLCFTACSDSTPDKPKQDSSKHVEVEPSQATSDPSESSYELAFLFPAGLKHPKYSAYESQLSNMKDFVETATIKAVDHGLDKGLEFRFLRSTSDNPAVYHKFIIKYKHKEIFSLLLPGGFAHYAHPWYESQSYLKKNRLIKHNFLAMVGNAQGGYFIFLPHYIYDPNAPTAYSIIFYHQGQAALLFEDAIYFDYCQDLDHDNTLELIVRPGNNSKQFQVLSIQGDVLKVDNRLTQTLSSATNQ